MSSGSEQRPAALALMLEGVIDATEQERLTRAYYAVATGDPGSFPVQFALYTSATVRVLNTALEKAAGERQNLSQALIAHAAELRRIFPTSPTPQPEVDWSPVAEQIAAVQADVQRLRSLKLTALLIVLAAVFIAGFAVGKVF